MNPMMYPLAKKLRIPPGGWPSHRSEFVIDGEPNRFGYVHETYKIEDGPPPAPDGKRRLFARVVGKRGAAVQLFEELADRPR